MEVKKSEETLGKLQISTDVIVNITKIATMEITDIHEISLGNTGMKGIFSKMPYPKSPVSVDITDDVAVITVSVIVNYGVKIPAVSLSVQENVKSSVQNMTGITVSKVNVIITGVFVQPQSEE